MRRTTSITLGQPLDNFVASLVDSGRYGSASEVVRSALRLLERQENEQQALQQAINAGLQSGISPYSLDELAEQVKRKHNV